MSEDGFAIRVKNVSKMYQLWNSPTARLMFPLKRLVKKSVDEKHYFREFYALNDISFDIQKGESWGFIGVNGSGKSTLLKIIAGNLRPSSGRVEVDGKVAILDYGSGFNGEFTGKENIYIKATLLGLNRKQINERFQSIIEFSELGNFINQPVKTYSSGMISRLGFAIMAHVDADIIITDEALAVGDVFFVQKCMQFIHDFLKKGTFLFVSHSTRDVLSLCQKAVWLEHGHIKDIGSSAQVTESYLNKSNSSNKVNLDKQKTDKEKTKSQVILSSLQSKDYKIVTEPKDSRAKYANQAFHQLTPSVPIFESNGSKDQGGISVSKVTLTDEEGQYLPKISGGELVTLTVEAVAERTLISPIVGFQVLDRLGQILFADNSYLMPNKNTLRVNKDSIFTTKFSFHMPLLPNGDYVFRVFIAMENEDSKIEFLKTVNNALAFHTLALGPRHGLVGIPMHSIKLKCYKNPTEEMAGKMHETA